MAHRHIDLGPLARRAQKDRWSWRRRRGVVRLDSRHHRNEAGNAAARAPGDIIGVAAAKDVRHDPRTGRPLHGADEAVETLSDLELQRELTIAALTSSRNGRFEQLLAERRRRHPCKASRWQRTLTSFATPTDPD